MKKVTAGFGEYNLKEIAQEFRDSASPTELEYVLPETVGGTKVLFGIKIQGFNQLSHLELEFI